MDCTFFALSCPRLPLHLPALFLKTDTRDTAARGVFFCTDDVPVCVRVGDRVSLTASSDKRLPVDYVGWSPLRERR